MLAKGTKLLRWDGKYVKVEDVEIGDIIIGIINPSNDTHEIYSLSQIQHSLEIFKIPIPANYVEIFYSIRNYCYVGVEFIEHSIKETSSLFWTTPGYEDNEQIVVTEDQLFLTPSCEWMTARSIISSQKSSHGFIFHRKDDSRYTTSLHGFELSNMVDNKDIVDVYSIITKTSGYFANDLVVGGSL